MPQFIDIESRIFGPITTRQFLIMMVCGMLDFIFYKIFYINTFIVIAVLNTGIFLIVAFLKINGMPFHYFVLNLIQTLGRPMVRIWAKEGLRSLPQEEKVEIKKEFIPKPTISSSRLSSLSLVINTGGAFKEEE